MKGDKGALEALCSVLLVCIDFCDLETAHNQKHLGLFLKNSAAVLFGSDFYLERDTLNDTTYAFDELARFSSFTLSNILLSYPEIINLAEAMISKRLRHVFKILSSSPELSVQRSLVIILRALYQHQKRSDNSSTDVTALIEKQFSSKRCGQHSALSLFQQLNLEKDDAISKAETISMTMSENLDDNSKCFKSKDCTVQVKSNGPISRRVPFVEASVDWNRNSIVLHRKAESPQYFPLYGLSQFEWQKSRTELHIHCLRTGDTDVVGVIIRFKPNSLSGSLKKVIELRFQKVMRLVKGLKDHDTLVRTGNRKTSKASRLQLSPKLGSSTVSRVTRSFQTLPAPGTPSTVAGLGQGHIFAAIPPHRVFRSDLSSLHIAPSPVLSAGSPEAPPSSNGMDSDDSQLPGKLKRKLDNIDRGSFPSKKQRRERLSTPVVTQSVTDDDNESVQCISASSALENDENISKSTASQSTVDNADPPWREEGEQSEGEAEGDRNNNNDFGNASKVVHSNNIGVTSPGLSPEQADSERGNSDDEDVVSPTPAATSAPTTVALRTIEVGSSKGAWKLCSADGNVLGKVHAFVKKVLKVRRNLYFDAP